MAVGTQVGEMVATEDLVVGDEVIVDHTRFEVDGFLIFDDHWTVMLVPAYGDNWHLEVGAEDLAEPIWERA